MRKLSIDGREYVWRVYRRRPGATQVIVGTRSGPGPQVFMAAQTGYPAAPLRVLFADAEAYPPRVGIILAGEAPPGDSPSRCFNLHLPRTAEAIIRHALATVWKPSSGVSRALEIQDGSTFILSLPADVMNFLGPRE